MSLRKKILHSMVIPGLLLCTVGMAGILSLLYLKQAAGRILAQNYRTIEESRNMERVLRIVQMNVLAGNPLNPSAYDSLVRRFELSLARCEQNITEDGEDGMVRRIWAAWHRMKSQLTDQERGDNPIAVFPDARVSVIELHEHIDSLVAVNQRAMFLYEEKTRTTADMMLFAVGTLLLLAAGALLSFSLVSARRISAPIVEVSSRLHHALNPGRSAEPSGKPVADEIALLREELDSLLDRLSRYDDEQRQRLLHMQSRLAFVINEVLEGLVLIDDQLNIVAVNRVAREILCLAEFENNRLDQIHPRDDVLAMLKPLIDGSFQPEHDLGELKFVVGGTERVYRPRVHTVSSDTNRIDGYLLLFWDITEQRRFEESRRRFISMLSHQLKTPMTSLSMSVNLLREKLTATDSSQAELLTIASEDCGALAGLISDLIEAAREPMPDLKLRIRHIDITKLIRTGLRPLIAQAKEKGVTLTMPPEQVLLAWVDPVKFPWVITNIAGNALRYTAPNGKVEVSIIARQSAFTVCVSDTGAGIPKEDLPALFEPYVTLDQEPQRGTHGLGLAIAKEIVEAHGGTIAVESTVGTGTTFHVTVPFDIKKRLYEQNPGS